MIKFQIFLLSIIIVCAFSNNVFAQVWFIKGEKICDVRNTQEKSLLDAVKKGNKLLVEKLLQKGGNADLADNCDIPLITYAAKMIHYDLLKMLIELGANVNAIDNFYVQPPLFWLIDSYEHQNNLSKNENADKIYESIKLLIKNGADVNLRGKFSDSALIKAALLQNVRLVEILIASGAEINFQNDRDLTAYSYAAQLGNKDLKRILIEAGADTNIGVQEYLKEYNENAFFQAAADGRTDVIEAMIASGTDVNIANEAGKMTALMRATEESTVDSLLAAEANVNLQDKTGHTALIWAVLFRRTNVVQKLIAADADVNLRNFEGKSALDLVSDATIKTILIEAGAK